MVVVVLNLKGGSEMKMNYIICLVCFTFILFFSTVCLAGTMYISGKAELVFLDDADLTGPNGGKVEFDAGWGLDGAFGYDHGNYRAELELAFRENNIDAYRFVATGGEVRSSSFLVNGYFDFENATDLTPFLSGGLGMANVDFDDSNINDDDTVFAYQVGAGVGLAISETIIIDLVYRYLVTANPDIDNGEAEYETHNLLVGIRYYFQ
jgi:opacity protein-like surface antigen